ncbi:transglycosylase SLT domain-containing protein [Bdellovibrio sp. HCB337]|uniref:lytic transglycosylase domain-containing protein n=1 Tax=Bdellovibrio sp. HCB337 TaxID=3394358 RepID=UPI0039A618C3
MSLLSRALCLSLAISPMLAQSSLAASSEPLKVQLQKDLEKLNAKNLYDVDPKVKEASLPVLSRMKYFEIKKRWKECGALGPKVVASNAEIQAWVAASWLKCEIKNTEGAKDKKSLAKPVDWLRKRKELLTDGPWKKSLWQDYVTAQLTLLEIKRTPIAVNELLESEDLPNEARATLLGYAGEYAEKKDSEKALYLYEQSIQLRDNKTIRDRLDAMKAASKLKFSMVAPGIEGMLENEGAEAALEEKMNKSLKGGDLMGALKTSVVIQTEYAGSKVARRLKDKPFEIYQQLNSDAPADEKNEKAFSELEKIDATRRMEWTQLLHRRADYNQALIFAESTLKDLYQTSNATILYWYAGRAAHLIGQYDRAQTHFLKLIEFHAGTEEAAEALLRSGLIHLRMKNYESAVVQFDKLLAQKKDKFDLQARYWLVRSLENIEKEKERAGVEAKILIERYPFSYYGIRLTAEVNKGSYLWPNAVSSIPANTSEMWLMGEEKNAWKRFKTLTKAGWLLEAQSEVALLPTTKNPWLEYHLAKFMSKSFQFPTAIRWMAEAMDLENSLRSPETLSYVYPKAFSPWVEGEAKKYNLNPILVRSLIRQESAFGIRAQSTANAQGLMQLIPSTAQDVARRLGMKKLEFPEDVFRPEINIPLGTFYISSMIDQFAGNVPFALGAYNAGPTKMRIFTEARSDIKDLVNKGSSTPVDEIWFDELPWSETSFYIKAILRNSLLYKLLDSEKVEWNLVLWQDLHNKKANLK